MRSHYYLLSALCAIFLCTPSSRSDGARTSAASTNDTITLRGTAASVEGTRDRDGGVFLLIHLDLTLVNTRSVPLIFLIAERPEYSWRMLDRIAAHPYILGAAMFEEPELTTSQQALADSFYGPSNYRDEPEWKSLRARLNLPRPPEDKVQILRPNEEWHFQDVLKFGLPDSLVPYCRITGVCAPPTRETGWHMKFVWLRVSLEIWPTNLEPLPRNDNITFGHTLQRRWLKYGVLQIDDVLSEPIKFVLNEGGSPPGR